jgi:hypothetical protein
VLSRHLYLTEQREKKAGSMSTISAAWRNLTAAEKVVYERKSEEACKKIVASAGDDDIVVDISAHTPMGLGDAEFPLREEFVEPLCANVATRKALCKSWRASYGDKVSEPALPFVAPAPPSLTCRERLGRGQCESRLTDEVGCEQAYTHYLFVPKFRAQ